MVAILDFWSTVIHLHCSVYERAYDIKDLNASISVYSYVSAWKSYNSLSKILAAYIIIAQNYLNCQASLLYQPNLQGQYH